MDRTSRSVRLLVAGLVTLLLASIHWLWLVANGSDTTWAFGSFTGAMLVVVFSIAWIARERVNSSNHRR